ncbi:MAG: hypothetical protein EOO91_08140 [Pedobacter sp.]|nr:MAG: hypothetical protein EOO91_08140 [Pedobacter sp.]
MKKLAMFSITLLIFICSCKQKDNVVDLPAIKEKIAQNKNYIAYSNDMNELMLAGVNREISYKGANINLLNQEISKATTLEKRIELYKRVGIIGGEKLATLQFSSNDNLIKLLKEMPELKNLSKEQLADVLMFKSTVGKEDIEKSAGKILNPEK